MLVFQFKVPKRDKGQQGVEGLHLPKSFSILTLVLRCPAPRLFSRAVRPEKSILS